MKKDILIVALFLLAPYVAWMSGAIDLHLAGIVLLGIAILLFVIGLVSRFGLSVPRGDVSYFYPVNTTSHMIVLSLIALVVGFILIWLF